MEPLDPKNHDQNAGLGSTEYRAKLLTKLNCLMAVLEVAITKIERSMELPAANHDRLSKIRANLENTLSICVRAKETLEKAMNDPAKPPAPAPADQRLPARTSRAPMSYRDYVELSSIEEYQKFKNLPPIDSKDLDSADLDDLLRKLYEV